MSALLIMVVPIVVCGQQSETVPHSDQLTPAAIEQDTLDQPIPDQPTPDPLNPDPHNPDPYNPDQQSAAEGEGSVAAPIPEAADKPLPEYADQPTWLDQGQGYVVNSADALADRIDRFFGSPRTDLEAAYSSLRLTVESDWEESEGASNKVKLRGKVHLPRLNKKLSLVFSDEEGDDQVASSLPPVLANDSDSDTNTAGLQYRLQAKQRSRVDLKLGLRSSGQVKASVRYRYEVPWRDKLIGRYTQRVYFIDGEGFGTRVSTDLDRLIDKKRLVRWSNYGKYAEDIDGVEWSSQISFAQTLNRKAAVSVFSWVGGETRPNYLTTSYGLGTRYRRNFYRRWLFYELEPAFAWKRENVEDSRDTAWLFTVRLEAMMERDRNSKKR